MKDKLPNDRLEDFLRKSLGDHSEEPPGDLWSKIAENLEPPVVVQPRILPLRRWWAVAAAAVVMGLLVGQHLYFNAKLDQMGRKLERAEQEMRKLEEEKTTVIESLVAENEREIAAENGVASQKTKTDIDQNSVMNGSSLSAPHSKKGTTANAGANLTQGKKNIYEAEKNKQKLVPAEEVTQESSLESVANAVENGTEAQSPILENGEQANFTETDMPRVWPKDLRLLDLPATPAPSVGRSIIPASKLAGNNYTVGATVMPMVSKNSISAVKPLGHGMGDRKSFRVNREKSEQAWMAGVAMEAKIAPKLRVGTGLNYRTVDYKTSHLINFDFKDRRHGGGHSNDREHDFEYDLNTAIGNVEMEIRAVSNESAEDIPENTKVLAKIYTSEHFNYLSVPFYANYSLGGGRLRVVTKAGVLLNFLEKSEFSIDQIKSLTTKFQFKEKERNSGSPANLQSVTVDYLAGVGLEYYLSNAFSLRLEPTIIGSLTSRHNNSRIQSSEFSAGINAGVMYNF